VEIGNPSALATVNCKLCKSTIELYCLDVIVIKSACVTEVVINPINRRRSPLICDVYHYTRYNIYISVKCFLNSNIKTLM
jgi:hypothetical protein